MNTAFNIINVQYPPNYNKLGAKVSQIPEYNRASIPMKKKNITMVFIYTQPYN